MIYEVRTYRLVPGSLGEVMKRFEKAYEDRKQHSEMSAFFYTEIGPLNEITHIWPYESLDQRAAIRAEANKSPHWPPDITEFQKEMRSEIFVPFPFTPEFKPGKHGPVFEWRSYFIKPGSLPATIERWSKAIGKRTELSPVLMAMSTDLGDLNRFVHIWPYQSLEHRREVRARAAAEKIWPPPGGQGTLVTQDNKIVFAAPFSPIQ